MGKTEKELAFELGQWVSTEDGYGQIMYIRPLYVENYETYRQERKNGEFIRYIFICKILCDFKGKIKNQKRISTYTSISKIDKEGAAFVKEIKTNQPDEYRKYILFDDKVDLCGQLFLSYKLSNKQDLNMDDLKQKMSAINKNLYPAFTFNEFVKECNEQAFPVKVDDFRPYGSSVKKEEQVTIRLDSYLYKTKGKEAVFHKAYLFE
jgi:hypothetical protein